MSPKKPDKISSFRPTQLRRDLLIGREICALQGQRSGHKKKGASFTRNFPLRFANHKLFNLLFYKPNIKIYFLIMSRKHDVISFSGKSEVAFRRLSNFYMANLN